MIENLLKEKEYREEKNNLTIDQKRKWWGEGEWVYEPDEVYFNHNGIDCKITRTAAREPCQEEHIFGGHLCGYVSLPGGHPWWGKKYEDMNVEVHGDLTFGECSDRHWIGFDCGHSYDVIPSMIKIYYKLKDNIIKKYKNLQLSHSGIFDREYRNIAYVESECRKLADQVIAANEQIIKERQYGK